MDAGSATDATAFLGPTRSPPNVGWRAVPPTALFFFAYLCQAVVLNRVVLMRTCTSSYGAPCDSLSPEELDHASAQAGLLYSRVQACFSVLSIVSASWLAAASDVVGRKPILIVSTALTALSSVGAFLVLELDWPLVWLLVFYTASGVGGTFTAYNAAIFAYVADTSAEAVRPARFGILESAIWLGAAIGPVVGAFVLGHVSESAPFLVSGASYALIVAYVALLLPESVPNARVNRLCRVSWLRTTWALLRMLRPWPTPSAAAASGGRGHGVLEPPPPWTAPWLLAFCVMYSCDNEWSTLSVLLTGLGNSSAVNLPASGIALLTASNSLSRWLILCLVMPLVVRLFGPARAPAVALRVAPMVSAAAVCASGVAPSAAALFGLVPIQALAVLMLPAIRSMLSMAHAPSRQGQVLGAVSIAEATSCLVAPLLGGQLWAACVQAERVPLCFLVLGGVMAAAAAMSMCLRPLPVLSQDEMVGAAAAASANASGVGDHAGVAQAGLLSSVNAGQQESRGRA